MLSKNDIKHHIALNEMGMYSTLEHVAPGALSFIDSVIMMMNSQGWYDLAWCLSEDVKRGVYPPRKDSIHRTLTYKYLKINKPLSNMDKMILTLKNLYNTISR